MLMFMVTVDGHFLTKNVDDLFKSHQIHKIPFMNGVNNDEGGYLIAQVRFVHRHILYVDYLVSGVILHAKLT